MISLFPQMIRRSRRHLVALLCLVVVAGCRDATEVKNEDVGQLPEAIAVRRAFESSSPSHRNPINGVLALVRAGGINPAAYSEALPQLETLAANPTFSADQKRLLSELIQRLKSELASPAVKSVPR